MLIVSWFGAMLDGIGFLVGSWVGFSLWRRFSVVAKQLPEKNLCLWRKCIWWSSILRLNSYIYVVWIELLQYWLLTSNHVHQHFNFVPWMIGPDFSWLEKISIVFLALPWKILFSVIPLIFPTLCEPTDSEQYSSGFPWYDSFNHASTK